VTIIFVTLSELLWSLALLVGDHILIFWQSSAFFPL
jgi:hypothetical protein